MGNELLLIIGFTLFSLFVTAAWIGGYLDPYQKKLQDLALDKMGDNRASYGIKSTEKIPRTHEIMDRKANDLLQAPYLRPRQETRTLIKLKGIWVMTLEARSAKEVLARASAILYQRGYDPSHALLQPFMVWRICWQRIWIYEEASMSCFGTVESDLGM